MVNTIYQYGEDALNNEATIQIDTSLLVIPNLVAPVEEGALNFRATSFSVPAYEVSTYEQSYKGFSIQRWKPGTGMTREVSITFRIDKYWKVYDFLKTWLTCISDIERDGAVFPDVSENGLRTNITIQQIANLAKGEKIVGKGWVFTGVFPKNIGEVSFDTTAEGETQTVSVTFGFIGVSRGEDK